MVLGDKDAGIKQPMVDNKESLDLIDYFCPHCKGKLFRGRVAEIKMVCPHCNTLVRSTGAEELEALESSEE